MRERERGRHSVSQLLDGEGCVEQVQNVKISHLLDKLNLRSPSDTRVGDAC